MNGVFGRAVAATADCLNGTSKDSMSSCPFRLLAFTFHTLLLPRYSTVTEWSSELRKTTPQNIIFMRPSSLGGGRILRRTLSVRLSVRPSSYQASRGATLRIKMTQRAAYRTAISAAQACFIDF